MQWRDLFTGNPVREDGWNGRNNTQGDFIFWCWNKSLRLRDASHLNFRASGVVCSQKINLAFLEAGATPSQHLLNTCWFPLSFVSLVCVYKVSLTSSMWFVKINTVLQWATRLLLQTRVLLIWRVGSLLTDTYKKKKFNISYTNFFFFFSKVKNSVTTNDSEVIIAGCQWIGICLSEKTVCPRSISLQTDWQPVSAACV